MLQLASNQEPPLPGTIRPIFTHNLETGGGCFMHFFEPLYLLKISKNRDSLVDVKFEDLQRY